MALIYIHITTFYCMHSLAKLEQKKTSFSLILWLYEYLPRNNATKNLIKTPFNVLMENVQLRFNLNHYLAYRTTAFAEMTILEYWIRNTRWVSSSEFLSYIHFEWNYIILLIYFLPRFNCSTHFIFIAQNSMINIETQHLIKLSCDVYNSVKFTIGWSL